MTKLARGFFAFSFAFSIICEANSSVDLNKSTVECRDVETNQIVKSATIEKKTELKPIVLIDNSANSSAETEVKVKRVNKKKKLIMVSKALPEKPVTANIEETPIKDEAIEKLMQKDFAQNPGQLPPTVKMINKSSADIRVQSGTGTASGNGAVGVAKSVEVKVEKSQPRSFVVGTKPTTLQVTQVQTGAVIASGAGATGGSSAGSTELTLEKEIQIPSSSKSVSASKELSLTSQSKTQIKNTNAIEEVSRKYMAFVAGTGGYPDASNVTGSYAVTGAFGTYRKKMMLEAGVSISKYDVNIRNYNFVSYYDKFDVNQYSVFGSAKYVPFDWTIQPNLGVIASYAYRQYSLTNGLTNNSGDTGNSSAFDAGITAGLDFAISESYSLGGDLKYMFNLSNRVNANYANPTMGYVGTPIENFQYYIVGLSARMNF